MLARGNMSRDEAISEERMKEASYHFTTLHAASTQSKNEKSREIETINRDRRRKEFSADRAKSRTFLHAYMAQALKY